MSLFADRTFAALPVARNSPATIDWEPRRTTSAKYPDPFTLPASDWNEPTDNT
jgi:hypothetical protein